MHAAHANPATEWAGPPVPPQAAAPRATAITAKCHGIGAREAEGVLTSRQEARQRWVDELSP